MRPLLFILPAALFLVVSPSSAQLVNGRFSTSFYAWEKFDTVGVSRTIYRAFQNVQLDITEGDLSFHSHLTGSANLSESFGDDGAVRVRNLFLRMKRIGGRLDASIGRIPVFAGVGNGVVDGGLLRLRLLDERISVVGYGGANVPATLVHDNFQDLDRNFLVGGQVTGSPVEGSRVGLSYVNRHRKRTAYWTVRADPAGNPIPVYVDPDSRAEQLIGFDADYRFSGRSSVYGRYDYDLNIKRSVRGQLTARIGITERLAVTGEAIYREPRIPYNSYFTIFPLNPVREVETGAEYELHADVRTYARFAYVSYTDDLSRRVTIGANTSYGSASYSGTNGYAGRIDAFSGQAMYPLFDRRFIPTVGFSFSSYRIEGDSEREELVAVSAGGVYRPVPAISVDAQIQWLQNPIAKSDVRGFAKVQYWFSRDLKFFQRKESNE